MKLAGQRRHDLRIGAQPGYVDAARVDANSVLIEPAPPSIMRDICQERRAQRDMQRVMKRNASVATVGIVTFGSEAAMLFERMSVAQQDAAFQELTQALADRLNTTVHGLVVHRDEATVHGHFQLAAFDLDGHPLAKTTRPVVLSGLQDLAAEVMARHCPGIERGRRYGDRLAAGADYADVVHRSVRELHRDLPRDLEVKRAKLADLAAVETAAQERVEEMSGRVSKLREKGELTAKEVKRLVTYESRLADRVQELELAREASEKGRVEEERLAGIARQDHQQMLERTRRLERGVDALTVEADAGTIGMRNGKVSLEDPSPVRSLPELMPLARAIAGSVDAKRSAAAEARSLITQASRDATSILGRAAEVIEDADRRMRIVQDREGAMRKVITRFRNLLDRVGRRLGLPAAETLRQSLDQLDAELDDVAVENPFSAPAEQAVDPGRLGL